MKSSTENEEDNNNSKEEEEKNNSIFVDENVTKEQVTIIEEIFDKSIALWNDNLSLLESYEQYISLLEANEDILEVFEITSGQMEKYFKVRERLSHVYFENKDFNAAIGVLKKLKEMSEDSGVKLFIVKKILYAINELKDFKSIENVISSLVVNYLANHFDVVVGLVTKYAHNLKNSEKKLSLIYYNIGEIYLSSKEIPNSLKYFEKSFQVNSNNVGAVEKLKDIYEGLNEPKKASSQCVRLSKIYKDFNKQKGALEEGLKLHPTSMEIKKLLSDIYVQEKNFLGIVQLTKVPKECDLVSLRTKSLTRVLQKRFRLLHIPKETVTGRNTQNEKRLYCF